MFNNIKKRLSDMASAINGRNIPKDDSVETFKAQLLDKGDRSDDTQPVSGNRNDDDRTVETARQVSEKGSSLNNNAIDNRDQAVRLIVESLREATGTKSKAFERLDVVIVYQGDVFDPRRFAWADDKMLEDLRRELDNALLTTVGSQSLELCFVSQQEAGMSQMVAVVEGVIYLRWRKPEQMAVDGQNVVVEIVPDTGSLITPRIELQCKPTSVYHIGRGSVVRMQGSIRRNQIAANENEADPRLLQFNRCVSSAHADIVVRNGRFCLRACPGGCRAIGGAPTKVIRGERIDELVDTSTLFPLADGDMIELGKAVVLQISISNR